jgi:oligoendopeptidase F
MQSLIHKEYPRNFLSKEFNPRIKEELENAYNQLLNSDINTLKDLEKFLDHWSELGSIIDQAGSIAYVDMTVDTKNKEYEEKYLHMVEVIYPICDKYENLLKEKFLSSSLLSELDSKYYSLFLKRTESEKKIFREENTPLFVEDAKLSQNYQKITGAWMVEYEGKKYTVQQMAIYQENPDREIREKTYKARVSVHLKDKDALENLYDEMLKVRTQIALNSGFQNYRDYAFVSKGRFDYTPDDCLRMHDAISETIVPLLVEWNKEKCKKLNIDTLRPWDLYVDPDGKGTIKAFETEEELCDKVENIFLNMNDLVGEYFRYMRQNKLLDLGSREGKAPGGYMTELSEVRVPFIFMNAVGSRRDVDTLLHESGHSFHAFQARDQVLKSYRSSPLEFAEVASMSMELLGRKYFHYVYNKEDRERVQKDQLIKIVEFFPFMSMIDSFQHWVYTTKNNDRVARGEKWTELNSRFQPFLDMSGLDEILKTRWQYPHVYTSPFYYIEYGIAQLGALMIWKNSLNDEKKAIKDYLFALSLGGSAPLPDLFKAANIEFVMDKKNLSELVNLIRDEIAK